MDQDSTHFYFVCTEKYDLALLELRLYSTHFFPMNVRTVSVKFNLVLSDSIGCFESPYILTDELNPFGEVTDAYTIS
jgi:hypothetical protein